MPELPEVENLKIGLERFILRQKILSVSVRKPKLVSGKSTKRSPSESKRRTFIKEITGEKILRIDRRAKNLIFHLSYGKIILVHLKMTGQFVYRSKNHKDKILGGHPIEIAETVLPNRHTHIVFELSSGTLYYNDIRMFGYVLYFKDQEALDKEKHFDKLGLEPLDQNFTVKYFAEELKKKKSKIKSVLLDQDIVVGIGNIYADESLFEAGISPIRPANKLKIEEVGKLHKAIKRIIKRAIATGGSSVATYRLLDNTRGNYAREHKVYGKKGGNCIQCDRKLKKIIIQSRTTIYCPTCQK